MNKKKFNDIIYTIEVNPLDFSTKEGPFVNTIEYKDKDIVIQAYNIFPFFNKLMLFKIIKPSIFYFNLKQCWTFSKVLRKRAKKIKEQGLEI